MDIPREKNAANPVPGRLIKSAEAQVRPPAAPAPPPGDLEDVDLDIEGEVFHQPVISPPPRPAASTEIASPPSPPAPPEIRDPGGRNSRKKPLERRSGDSPLAFKRFITRPETAYTSHAAADQARAETPVHTDRVDHGNMQFGKIHANASPNYRPNRLFRVLDGIYVHSPLKGLDLLDRINVRFVFIILLCLGLVGWAMFRYFGSFGQRIPTPVAGAPKEITLSVSERIDRGRKTVEAYLAARSIEEKLPLVIDPDRAAPRMREFYNSMKGEDPKVMAGWEVGEPVKGEQGAWLPFTFLDSTGTKVTIPLAERETGCQLDWENFTSFSEAPWAEYCRERPTTPKFMRVRLRRVESYAGIYSKDKWQAYAVQHRSGGPLLIGYSDRSARTAQALAGVVKSDKWQSAQVYLRFETVSSGENFVLIDDIIRSRWQDEVISWTAPVK